MKKTYQQPHTVLVNISPRCHLLTGSNTIVVNKEDEIEVNYSRVTSHSVWDDERDEEDEDY